MARQLRSMSAWTVNDFLRCRFGINPLLMTWKPCGLAQRVRFSGLAWHEAGIYPAENVARELFAVMIPGL
jgi:hypothetical protein